MIKMIVFLFNVIPFILVNFELIPVNIWRWGHDKKQHWFMFDDYLIYLIAEFKVFDEKGDK